MSSQLRAAVPREQTGNSIRDSALGLVPETVEPLIALNERVWTGGPVRPALLEVVRLRNARHVNCVYCRSVRYDVARAARLTADKGAATATSAAISTRARSSPSASPTPT